MPNVTVIQLDRTQVKRAAEAIYAATRNFSHTDKLLAIAGYVLAGELIRANYVKSIGEENTERMLSTIATQIKAQFAVDLEFIAKAGTGI